MTANHGPRLPWRYRIIAIAFGLGSLEHTIGLVGLWFGWHMYANYPGWRHAAFASVDASIAWLAMRRPDRLFVPLLALLGEQVATNGIETWQVWLAERRVQWLVVATLPLFAAAVFATRPTRGRERRRRAS
jgi:hypothetical protein